MQHTFASSIIKSKKEFIFTWQNQKTSSEVKNRWNEKNYDRITVMAPKGKKEVWSKIAKEKGFKGLSGYIIDCVEKAGE